MNFNETKLYLLSLGNEVSAMKLGLESIRKLLKALGDPHKNYLNVQVAGTNGKGSVCAFLNSICVSAGIETGIFTSPHLVSITERVQINGVPINEAEFANYATTVRNTAEALIRGDELETVPTFFEQVTAIALLAFADRKVEIAILETGLGGRLDATTAAEAEIGVITRIDYDHQEYLGESLESIAREKAAIIRPDRIVVVGEQPPEALKVILDRCTAFGLKPKLASLVGLDTGARGLVFTTKRGDYHVQNLGLLGAHQIENAKTAILSAEALIDKDFDISTENITAGLRAARHAGRLEFHGRFLFDGSHNVGGAKALRAFLDQHVDRPITLIYGSMRDKQVNAIAAELFPAVNQIILTRPANSRSMSPSEIASAIPGKYSTEVILTSSVEKALTKADELTSHDGIILVTGSLYLVGEAKSIIENQAKIGKSAIRT